MDIYIYIYKQYEINLSHKMR